MIHERKLTETHRTFCEMVKEYVPELNTAKNCYIITEGEAAAINDYFPNLSRNTCWNHVIQNFVQQLMSLTVSPDETRQYIAQNYSL